MRARIFLVCGAITLIASAGTLQACGETEPTATPVADSGPDVVDSGPASAAPVDEDAATCDLSADFSTKIPDASIADGASTSGLCLQCAKSKCEDQVAACNQDCSCQELATDALGCFLANTANPIVCAGNFTGVDTSTQQLGFAILNCLNDGCKQECAADAFTPKDAGTDAN